AVGDLYEDTHHPLLPRSLADAFKENFPYMVGRFIARSYGGDCPLVVPAPPASRLGIAKHRAMLAIDVDKALLGRTVHLRLPEVAQQRLRLYEGVGRVQVEDALPPPASGNAPQVIGCSLA